MNGRLPGQEAPQRLIDLEAASVPGGARWVAINHAAPKVWQIARAPALVLSSRREAGITCPVCPACGEVALSVLPLPNDLNLLDELNPKALTQYGDDRHLVPCGHLVQEDWDLTWTGRGPA